METVIGINPIVHDVQTMATYAWDNWGYPLLTKIQRPQKIFLDMVLSNAQDHDKQARIIHTWEFVRCIKLYEGDTHFALLDMTGNADRLNDTVVPVIIYSKIGPDDAEGVYERFLQLMQTLAHENTIGVYAFVQITNKKVKRSRFYTQITADIFLTRRGIGHL
jgi:hypothetical protein